MPPLRSSKTVGFATTGAPLSAERARALQLGRQVDNLQDLVANLNRSPDGANRQTRLAARPGDEKKVDSRPDLTGLSTQPHSYSGRRSLFTGSISRRYPHE